MQPKKEDLSDKVEAHKLALEVHQQLARMWSGSTWKGRKRVWRRYAAFAEQMTGTPTQSIDGHLAAMWVQYRRHRRIKLQTAISEVSALLALTQRIPTTNLSELTDYIAAMRKQVRPGKIQQALPLTREQIDQLTAQWSETAPAEATALWLAWKTASRWSDINKLTRRSLKLLDDKRMMVVFYETKTQNGEYRPDHVVLVHENAGLPAFVTETLNQMTPGQLLTTMTTNALARKLANLPVNLKWRHDLQRFSWGELRQQYSAHSIKRGAIHRLWEAAANGSIEVNMVSFMAKHKTDFKVSQNTVRYAPNLYQVARAMGSEEATRLL